MQHVSCLHRPLPGVRLEACAESKLGKFLNILRSIVVCSACAGCTPTSWRSGPAAWLVQPVWVHPTTGRMMMMPC